jgi:WD40 repeat protein
MVASMTHYKTILTVTPDNGTITCLAFSPFSASRLASGTDKGVVQIWDTRNGTALREIKRRAPVSSLLWDPTSHHLFVGAADGSIIFFNTDGVDVSEKHSAHCLLPV